MDNRIQEIELKVMYGKKGLINRVNNCTRYQTIAGAPVDLTLLPKSRTLPDITGYFSNENIRILKNAGLV